MEEINNYVQNLVKESDASFESFKLLCKEMMEKFSMQSKEMESRLFKLDEATKDVVNLLVQDEELLKPNQNDIESIKVLKVMILNNEFREVSNTIELISAKLVEHNLYKRKYEEEMTNTLKFQMSLNNQIDVVMRDQYCDSVVGILKLIKWIGTSEKEILSSSIEYTEQMKKLNTKLNYLVNHAMDLLKTLTDGNDIRNQNVDATKNINQLLKNYLNVQEMWKQLE